MEKWKKWSGMDRLTIEGRNYARLSNTSVESGYSSDYRDEPRPTGQTIVDIDRGCYDIITEETMRRMVRDLEIDMAGPHRKTLTSLVFSQLNFAMAMVGPEGCRLMIPDGSVTMIVPEGALDEDTVIYVFKDIQKSMDSEVDGHMLVAPRLLCGSEGTTFKHPVILMCRHQAAVTKKHVATRPSLVAFKRPTTNDPELQEKCEEIGHKEVKVDGGMITLRLKSFSEIFICGRDETGKKMCCIHASKWLARRVTRIYLVIPDDGVIKHVKGLLTNDEWADDGNVCHFTFIVMPNEGDIFISISGDTEKGDFHIPSSELGHIGFQKLADVDNTCQFDVIEIRQSSNVLASELLLEQEVHFDGNQPDEQFAQYVIHPNRLPSTALVIGSRYRCVVSNGGLTDEDRQLVATLDSQTAPDEALQNVAINIADETHSSLQPALKNIVKLALASLFMFACVSFVRNRTH